MLKSLFRAIVPVFVATSFAGAADCSLSFACPGEPVGGLPGEAASFEAFAMVSTAGIPDGDIGVQGWSLGIECEGGSILPGMYSSSCFMASCSAFRTLSTLPPASVGWRRNAPKGGFEAQP